MFKNLLYSEKGSVMLEFCLVLPIYLLIFGGTFLLFDLSMGKLHLQESNRNLAWLQDDRYNGSDNLINKELYKRATAFYDARNALEKRWDPVRDFWTFGEKKSDSKGEDSEEYRWGERIKEIDKNNIFLKADNDFLSLYSGNMELKMDKVSAVYIGAVGASSVFAEDGRGPLYKSAYTLTRSFSIENGKQTDKADAVNPEMIIIRRTNTDTREDITTASLKLTEMLFKSWPYSDNIIDNARLILGL